MSMKCPMCGALEDRVIDSRTSSDGSSIRRRRECQDCSRRFTTYERVEETPRLIVKKDQTRQPFDRKKVLSGLLKACEKRPVPTEKLEELVDLVERTVQEQGTSEVDSRIIGEVVVSELKKIDQVSYVRFRLRLPGSSRTYPSLPAWSLRNRERIRATSGLSTFVEGGRFSGERTTLCDQERSTITASEGRGTDREPRGGIEIGVSLDLRLRGNQERGQPR